MESTRRAASRASRETAAAARPQCTTGSLAMIPGVPAMGGDEELLRARLESSFERLRDPSSPTFGAQERDFIFHMLDWKADLEKMAALYSEPGRFSKDQAHEVVQSFLYHASAHIVAAARLAETFLDSFGTSTGSADENHK